MDPQVPSGNLGTLNELEQALECLSPERDHDHVLRVLDAAVAIRQRAGDLHERCLALALIWVQENGPLVCGHLKWEGRCSRKTTCRDVVATADALLAAVGGELGAFTAHLQAQPYKHGACARTLDASTFEDLFKIEGDRRLRLIRIDSRFIKNGGFRQEESHE